MSISKRASLLQTAAAKQERISAATEARVEVVAPGREDPPAPAAEVEPQSAKGRPGMTTTAIRIPVELLNLLSEIANKRAREARTAAAAAGKPRPEGKAGRTNTSLLIEQLLERHRAELEAELGR